MKLIYKYNMFWLKCRYDERSIPKELGFVWHPAKKMWYTESPFIAYFLRDHSISPKTDKYFTDLEASIKASTATNSDYKAPMPNGLNYFGYQNAGIEYMIPRKSVLLADQMGIGKTIEVAGYINTINPEKVLIICPASVKLNWQRELEKWLIDYRTIGIAYGKNPFPDEEIVIINYDIISRFHDEIHGYKWPLLVCDECHYLKNPSTKRTKEIFGFKSKKPEEEMSPLDVEVKQLLTGTPILNRPKDLFPLLNYLDPKQFSSFFRFALRYCNAHKAAYGWDFDGASNLEELNFKLRSSIMLRRLKKDVLLQLPDKIRHTIEIPKDPKVLKAEQEGLAALEGEGADALGNLARIRHLTALAKIPFAINHIQNILDQGEKIVCFCWHYDVLSGLRAAFSNTCEITGRTPAAKRQSQIDKFQDDPEAKIFLANIQAGGVGITLTAASIAIFLELDWVPGNMSQAEDRLHRIGAKNNVLIQHLVMEDSVDAMISAILLRKQKIIDIAIDGKGVEDDRSVINELFSELKN